MSSSPAARASSGRLHFEPLLAAAEPRAKAAATTADDACFWLYSSGSTGAPKGAVHLHSHLILTAELYAKPVLGIAETDVVYSAAKLFFAYGLGNALDLPARGGRDDAASRAERPTPASVARILKEKRPSIFYGVPTLYAAMLASAELPRRDEVALRRCVSAGEALPEEIGRRWTDRFGVEILDGLGSTEMLHIFLSNRPGAVRYGTSGVPVPGYEVRIVDEAGARGRARRDRRVAGRGPDRGRALLEQSRALARHLSRPVDAQRRQIRPRRRRLSTPIAAAPTTCSRSAASMCRRSRSRPR